MIRLFATLLLMMNGLSLAAKDYEGIYNYNKGLNKANGTICLFMIKPDTAFFYLNNMSGAPDFNLTNLKGFLRIDSANFSYHKDSCKVSLVWQGNMIQVTQSDQCKHEFSVEGKYKRINNSLKKPNTWMTEYTEKNAMINADSAKIFQAPHNAAPIIMTLPKASPVKVIDEINGFYLVEIAKHKNEFMWTPKKNVSVSKN